MRLGLCCIFRQEPVKFRTTTATNVLRLEDSARLEKLNSLCLHNSRELIRALETVNRLGISAFRILSGLLPLVTHPQAGYKISDLPDAETILANFTQVAARRRQYDLRLSFHPDQFIVLSSPSAKVRGSSIAEIESHAQIAVLVGAETINIHAGGVYGDKPAALQRFRESFSLLSEAARERLTLENDDVSYTPEDLLPFCHELRIPLVYDVHHHRCNPDSLSVADATGLAAETWEYRGQPQHCHISSPKDGWNSANPKPHAEYINPADFPDCWLELDLTIDVEAKAKELAVLKLAQDLQAARQ